MSSVLNQAETSNPLQKKMRECTICKNAGFHEQMISFQNAGDDSTTGKIIWKPIDQNGNGHKHKFVNENSKKSIVPKKESCRYCSSNGCPRGKKSTTSGWEYKISYPATIASTPHFILIKKE